MNVATVVDVLIALAIFGAQIRYFRITRTAAAQLENLFPAEMPMATLSTVETVDDEDAQPSASRGVRVVSAATPSNAFKSILDAANKYLDRNSGMPVTFLVLQDIVERITEAYEQAPVATVTLPLYIGLMGTFLGVIVGLISLAGGQASSAEDADLSRFLSGILVAMVGSLLGLVLFVSGKQLVSRAQAAAGARKRDFYVFLQSELLPVAGQEVSTALYSLQANLLLFNHEFRANLQLFGAAMEAPARALQEQKELLRALEETDLKRIIKANADMLKALQTASPTLEAFLQSTQRFVIDLEGARDLTGKVSGLLDRLTTFESSVNGLGERLHSEGYATEHVVRLISAQLDALESRKKLIVQYTDVQDATIRKSLQEQETKVSELLAAANQELATLGQELTRSVASTFGGEKTSQLFDNIALLKDIARRTEASQNSLSVIASGSHPDPRVVHLLEQILSSLSAQGARPGLGNLIHRFFPGEKGGSTPHAE
jgi:hypothetical protein